MAQQGVFLGFDFGQVRIGVAVGNSFSQSARALAIVDGRTNAVKWAGIEKLVREWEPEAIVVGVPRHPDGTPHQVTALALKFARQMEGRHALPVFVVDERYSSVAVESDDDGPIDDEAAAVILQQWFDEGCPHVVPADLAADADAGKNA